MGRQYARYAFEKVLKYELTISSASQWREGEGGVMSQKTSDGAVLLEHLVDVVSDILELEVRLLLGFFLGLGLGSPDLWDGPHDLAAC